MNASPRCRSTAFAVSYSVMVSAADSVNGFSHSTCLPAVNAFSAQAACIAFGSVM